MFHFQVMWIVFLNICLKCNCIGVLSRVASFYWVSPYRVWIVIFLKYEVKWVFFRKKLSEKVKNWRWQDHGNTQTHGVRIYTTQILEHNSPLTINLTLVNVSSYIGSWYPSQPPLTNLIFNILRTRPRKLYHTWLLRGITVIP